MNLPHLLFYKSLQVYKTVPRFQSTVDWVLSFFIIMWPHLGFKWKPEMTRKHKRQKTTKPDLGLKKTDLKCFTFSSTKQGFFVVGRTLLAKQKFNRRTTVSNDLVRKQPSKLNGPDPMEPWKFPNPLRWVGTNASRRRSGSEGHRFKAWCMQRLFTSSYDLCHTISIHVRDVTRAQ